MQRSQQRLLVSSDRSLLVLAASGVTEPVACGGGSSGVVAGGASGCGGVVTGRASGGGVVAGGASGGGVIAGRASGAGGVVASASRSQPRAVSLTANNASIISTRRSLRARVLIARRGQLLGRLPALAITIPGVVVVTLVGGTGGRRGGVADAVVVADAWAGVVGAAGCFDAGGVDGFGVGEVGVFRGRFVVAADELFSFCEEAGHVV